MTESLHLVTMAGLRWVCGIGRVFTTPVVSLNIPEGVLVLFMRHKY